MYRPRNIKKIKSFLILFCVLRLIDCLPQDASTMKPGRYIPELYGAHLGKYIPDDSGKYYHIHRPYDGGYGDNGIKYVHDSRGNLVPFSTASLGPKDHLRFMLDFNFDNSGWQIINFEWLRDGDEHYNYKYVNENQLFVDDNENNGATADDSGSPEIKASADSSGPSSSETDVHIEGEYSGKKGYNYSYNNNDDLNQSSMNLQQAIREVIYYIENNVLPTL